MRLEEAIRVDTVLKKAPILKDDLVVVAALNLSIEAMKAILCGREGLRTEFNTPLLGETID